MSEYRDDQGMVNPTGANSEGIEVTGPHGDGNVMANAGEAAVPEVPTEAAGEGVAAEQEAAVETASESTGAGTTTASETGESPVEADENAEAVHNSEAVDAEEAATAATEPTEAAATVTEAAESAEAAVGSQQKPDMEALRKEVEQAEKAYTEASERSAELKALYSTDKGVLDALGVHSQERKQTAEKAARIERIYRRLAGKETAGRMDIETRVQRLYLENILVSANRRFREMSAGQFELRMTEEAAAAQGSNKGLDLMVYSNVTGTEREIRTLSGGESFMAALSLALGMSDQIQQSSASVNLDIMFIDEGFGSLDDHSRSQAIKVLRHMAGSSRLIGIISHVTELKQQIDDRLVVEKDGAGSHIHWVIS